MNKFQSDKEWLGRIIPSTGREKKNNIPLKSSPSTEKPLLRKGWRTTGHRWYE